MHLGIMTIGLGIPGAASLKDKRHVLRSLIDRARRKFNVSIAEIDDLDSWTHSVIAVAAVSNSRQHTNRALDSLLDHIEANPEVDVEGVELEID